MRYFVIAENGELYGPADLETLNQWILEGRIVPTSMIQEELGGARFAASLLEGLQFSTSPVPPPIGGESDFRSAWVFGVVGLFCCVVCAPIGLFYAFSAKKKGHPNALAPIIFCSLVTVFTIAYSIFYWQVGGIEGLMKKLQIPGP